MPDSRSTAYWLRQGLLALATIGVAGTELELASLSHWKGVQLIAWAALGLITLAISLQIVRPTPGRIRAAQMLALVVALTAAFGVFQHISANYDAAPLDARYAYTWDAMSEPARWWAAVTKAVGPAPPLAPAALAQTALCVLVATFRHPALRQNHEPLEPIEAATPDGSVSSSRQEIRL